MLAVIKTGGKQYLVKEGETIKVEKLGKKVGSSVTFDEVLLLIDEKNKKAEIGDPVVKNCKVKAEVLAEEKGQKVLVVKYKPKVRYHKKRGHRQFFTKIKITEIIVAK
jgi:large subunit ribosomal protein L21